MYIYIHSHIRSYYAIRTFQKLLVPCTYWRNKKSGFCKNSLLVTKHPGTLLIMLDPSPYSGHGGFLSHGGAPKKSSIFLEDFP